MLRKRVAGSNLADMGRNAARDSRREVGSTPEPVMRRRWGGHVEGLRRRCGDAVGVELDTSLVDRVMGPYCASKAGVLMMAQHFASELCNYRINVNAILPGTFITEQTDHYSENYRKAIIKARVPIGRLGDLEDAAATVVFLASDASAYITGVGIPVDGGVLLT